MNKHDFYKEIMSEYTFDKDKILSNAKKGKFAGRKPLPLYIGMTAAAAALVVAVGTAAFSLTNHRGAVYNGGNLAALDDKQRVDKAKTEADQNANSVELYDVMVSFNGALSPAEVQNVLTAYSDSSIPVKLLFLADGSKAVGGEQVGAVFESGNGSITGAIINCPGRLMKSLMNDSRVVLAEIATQEDFNSALPITTPIGNLTNIDNGDSDNSHNPPDIDVSGGGIDGDNSNSDVPDNSGADDPIIMPQNTEIKLPAGVNLPTGHNAGFSYITDDLGAERAYFLNENVFYVKTANSVRLYRWNGESESLAVSQNIEDAQACWISENGSRLIVTGKENGIRRKMFIIDAYNCTINDMGAESFVGDGTIAAAAYNENDDVLVVNVFDGEAYFLYTAHLNGYQAADAATLFMDGANVNILGEFGGTVYFSDSADGKTTIYKGEAGTALSGNVVLELEGVYSANVNSAFTHAVMTCTTEALGDTESTIFDPETESLIPASANTSFGVALHTCEMDGEYFKVENGALVKIDKSVANAAKIDFKRSFSATYMALVSNGSVRIVPSVYNSANKNAALGQPTENSTEELRAALNLGAGVINALATDKCAEAGLDTAEKLSEAIDECFTKSAGEDLKSRNESGNLTAVDISEAVLVIDENNENSADGTLYVKVGTFDGKNGYFAYNVRFAKERGCFRLDCVIG
ncbi:MAG: hypothetical protein K2N06_06775 [Oscillospiraceae bacterium]|nr:hypothetical protein [Oscillospiraceae bacterium]